LTLLLKIGPWGGRIFLIGGLTPHYLIGKAPSDMKEHVGTTDLDVVVGVLDRADVLPEPDQAFLYLSPLLPAAR
jgi:hypothetical protein